MKTLIILTLLNVLVGCGFQPLYKHSRTKDLSISDNDITKISIESIPNREGQILRNFLLDRFGTYENQPYTLSTTINIGETVLGIAADRTILRSRITITANFSLITKINTYSFQERSAASFSTVQSDYATLVAKEDAIKRGLRDIADLVRIRISTLLTKEVHR